MHDYFSVGKILVQVFTNGSCELTRNFQQRINYLFNGFDLIRAYIYDLLILDKEYWTYHIQKLELTLNKLKEKVLKCDIERSFFVKTEIE